MIEKHFSVLEGIIKVCLDDLAHIESRLNEDDFEDSMIFLYDTVETFYRMHLSILTVLDEFSTDKLRILTDSLWFTLDQVAEVYESGDWDKVLELMYFTLTPRYNKWCEELNRSLLPHLDLDINYYFTKQYFH